jgi:hypothetical protein
MDNKAEHKPTQYYYCVAVSKLEEGGGGKLEKLS